MGGQVVTKQEKMLVIESNTKSEFAKKYIDKIGTPSRFSRIDTIWTNRKLYREELGKVDIAPISKVSTAIVPHPTNNFPDQAESLAKIHNDLRELIDVQKEMLTLFKKIDGKEVKKVAEVVQL